MWGDGSSMWGGLHVDVMGTRVRFREDTSSMWGGRELDVGDVELILQLMAQLVQLMQQGMQLILQLMAQLVQLMRQVMQLMAQLVQRSCSRGCLMSVVVGLIFGLSSREPRCISVSGSKGDRR